MCDLRRKLNKNKFKTGSTYKIINSQIKIDMKKVKEDWEYRKCKEIDTYFTHNNTKKVYQIVKVLGQNIKRELQLIFKIKMVIALMIKRRGKMDELLLRFVKFQ